MADSEHGPSALLLAPDEDILFHSLSVYPFFINASICSSRNEEDDTILVGKTNN